MVEEAARGGIDVHFLADTPDIKTVESLHRAVRLTLDRAEGGEIVPPDQISSALSHRLDVQWHRNMPHASAIEGRRCSPIQYAVQILAPDT